MKFRCCYGFQRSNDKDVVVNPSEAAVVREIFNLYLAGYSLEGIAKVLSGKSIPSPSGNPVWNRASINKIPCNLKYVPHIISTEDYLRFIDEKLMRSNVDPFTSERTATRYCSNICKQ